MTSLPRHQGSASSPLSRASGRALMTLALMTLALIALGLLLARVSPLAAHPASEHALPASLTPSGGHLEGNPKAPVALVEYMSYTCPHCAAFEAESGTPLRNSFLAGGKVSFEVRHFLRDPADITAALIANCAPPARFFELHRALLAAQPGWFPIFANASPEQHKRWEEGDRVARLRALAADLNLYALAGRFGVSHESADRCLADQALTQRISAQTTDALKMGVEGTPSFSINGVLLTGTHSWDLLMPQLQARM